MHCHQMKGVIENIQKDRDRIIEPDELKGVVEKCKEFLSEKQFKAVRDIAAGYQQRLPNAVIIGCKKCGTSFLRFLLSRHPDIAMAPFEIHFFKPDSKDRSRSAYRKLMQFSFADQITMEKTPKYWVNESTPRYLHDMLPHVKLLLILREPACRMMSDFFSEKRKHRIAQNVTFQQIMNEERFIEIKRKLYEPSLFDDNMKRWLQHFPLSQFLIIKNEDLMTPKFIDVVKEIETFLGIAHRFEFDTARKHQICASSKITLREKCSAMRAGAETCTYDEQYKSVLDSIRDELKPRVKGFEALANKTLNWRQMK